MYKSVLTLSATCDSGELEQTVNHVVHDCKVFRTLHGILVSTHLDDRFAQWPLGGGSNV